MLQSQTKGQMMSFLLKTKSGKLIVVDGGRWDDGDYLMEQIRKEGGHVSAWFLTHAHTDHVGALLKLLTNEADGEESRSITFTIILRVRSGIKSMNSEISERR